ncbi:MAG TPA: GNAT family N-acetyltransferase [Candidatus Limnocylindrales bacterium]|nr:GNAT family N-acetyltransferase [Candidatus Limnocylindrales bacterium]
MPLKQPPEISPDTAAAAGRLARDESFQVLTLGTADELSSHVAAIEDLACSVVEANVFYEPWMILPALKAFGKSKNLIFVLLYLQGTNERGGQLCAFFPFERRTRFARLPARTLILWQYQECYLSTPLLRRGYELPAIRALVQWARNSPMGADVIEGIEMGGDGVVHSSLLRTLQSLGLKSLAAWRDRPLMVPRASCEEYMRQAISGDRRRVLRSRQRNLEKLGPIHYTEPMETTLDSWIDNFLDIEASGWKGRQKVAAVCHENTREFFRTVIREACRRGRLEAFTLNCGAVPVAARCSFMARPGAFLYKSAYQEQYARYSPGALLELERIRRAHENKEIHWVDSCVSASFDHYLPWIDRRSIADIAWSTGTLRGNLILRLAPLVRRLKEWLANRKPAVNPKGELVAQKPAQLAPKNVLEMPVDATRKLKAGGGE